MPRIREIYDPSPARGWLPWGVLAPILAVGFVIAGQFGGLPIVARLVTLDARSDPLDAMGLVAYTLVPFALTGLLVLAWVRWVERRSLGSIGLRGAAVLPMFATGHALGMLGIAGIVTLAWLAGGLLASGEATAWHAPVSFVGIALLLIGFAVQASVEELLFRGWLLSVLTRKFHALAGVLVSSAFFALLHFTRGEPWLVTVCDFAFGVFACAWVLRTRSIVGVMGWHAGWNWLLCVGFGLPLTGLDVGVPALLVDLRPEGPAWLSGGKEGPEGSVFCLAYFALGTVWLLRTPRRD